MLDFTPLSDDQLIDLIRSACQEAARRGNETRFAAESVALDEATKAKIAREAAEKAAADLHKDEARRIAESAAAKVKADAERAERDAQAAKIAQTWEYKEEMGAKISAIIKPTRKCELKVWSKGADKRIYIGGGYNDNDVTYYHTGNHKEKPKTLQIGVSRDLALTKEEIADAKAALLPVLVSICDKWNAITIPIPQWEELMSDVEYRQVLAEVRAKQGVA